jgi:MOSC domain-containing protein YiiM
MLTPACAVLIAGQGLEGDRYRTASNGARQVTLISREGLAAIASYLGRDHVAPELLRRNFVTEGINLTALKAWRFRIGSALLETSGECAPCSRMELALGPGGYNAVRGHGGITARILEGGDVRIGDAIRREP